MTCALKRRYTRRMQEFIFVCLLLAAMCAAIAAIIGAHHLWKFDFFMLAPETAQGASADTFPRLYYQDPLAGPIVERDRILTENQRTAFAAIDRIEREIQDLRETQVKDTSEIRSEHKSLFVTVGLSLIGIIASLVTFIFTHRERESEHGE